MIRATITIHGRVQGVGYRANAKRKATQYGLKGYTRNQPDGSVEIVAEGDPIQIEKLVAWCSHGPTMSHVTRINVENSAATGEYRDFNIRR
ncbi:MAG: acylphosphatase [Candidatus Bathyarchaeota archaeon]